MATNGEIMVKSPGLLKEHYKNPAATAEVLTADGWYHTSDAGFLDATATSKIIDRVKDVGRIKGGANDGAMFAPKRMWRTNSSSSRTSREAVALATSARRSAS